MKKLIMILLCLGLAACQRTPNQVFDKVLTDFGVREQPEGYVSGSDQVFQNLDVVGNTELKRLNLEERQGEIKFQEDGIRGMYYKEVKVYEAYYPIDAQPISRSVEGTRGYNGYIEYAYRVYQSPRRNSRVEAAAESANIPTDIQGRESYRYSFNASGAWNGGKGERTRR